MNSQGNPYLSNFRYPLYSGDAIRRLIPQREPMVQVDTFYGISGQDSFSGLTVKDDNLFCSNGVFPEEGIIEHFAQSAAARIGFIFIQNKEAVPVGFIGAVSKFTLYAHPHVGSELLTVVSILQEVGNITLAGIKSWTAEGLVAEGELKIYLNKE